jgi:4-aminobutyrate aminotransferase-like enzyme
LSELLKLRDEFEVVGDVRGKGFMLGLELVADKVRLFHHFQETRCTRHRLDACGRSYPPMYSVLAKPAIHQCFMNHKV